MNQKAKEKNSKTPADSPIGTFMGLTNIGSNRQHTAFFSATTGNQIQLMNINDQWANQLTAICKLNLISIYL